MTLNAMWCANCEQMVAPQKPKSNRGLVFVVLVVLGVTLLLFAWPLGVATLVFSALYLVVGLIRDVGAALAKATCPICKASSLLEHAPVKPQERAKKKCARCGESLGGDPRVVELDGQWWHESNCKPTKRTAP